MPSDDAAASGPGHLDEPELARLRADLRESREHLEATGEILTALGRSAADLHSRRTQVSHRGAAGRAPETERGSARMRPRCAQATAAAEAIALDLRVGSQV